MTKPVRAGPSRRQHPLIDNVGMDSHIGAERKESKMRKILGVAILLSAIGLPSCNRDTPPPPSPGDPHQAIEPGSAPGDFDPAPAPPVAAWTPAGGLPLFKDRIDPTPDRGSWMQHLTPTSKENCTFTERPASDRPNGLRVQAWSGNMDLLAEGEVLGHDHAIGFVESFFLMDRPVIVSRDGMPDLWIEPMPPHDKVTLRIGATEFLCVRSDA